MNREASSVVVVLAAILFVGCAPKPNEKTKQKIIDSISSNSESYGRGMLEASIRVGKEKSSGSFPVAQFEFTPSEKKGKVTFRFYSPTFRRRCTGTFDGKWVTFAVHKEHERWGEE